MRLRLQDILSELRRMRRGAAIAGIIAGVAFAATGVLTLHNSNATKAASLDAARRASTLEGTTRIADLDRRGMPVSYGGTKEPKPHPRYEGAMAALQNGRLAEAESSVTRLITEEPDDTTAWWLLAQVLYFGRRFGAAIEVTDRMSEEFGRAPRALEVRGRAWRSLGNHRNAVENVQEALSLDSTLSTAAQALGLWLAESALALEKDGKYAEARALHDSSGKYYALAERHSVRLTPEQQRRLGEYRVWHEVNKQRLASILQVVSVTRTQQYLGGFLFVLGIAQVATLARWRWARRLLKDVRRRFKR